MILFGHRIYIFCCVRFFESSSDFSELFVTELIVILEHKDIKVSVIIFEIWLKHFKHSFSQPEDLVYFIAKIANSTRMVSILSKAVVNEAVDKLRVAFAGKYCETLVASVQMYVGCDVLVDIGFSSC